MTAATRAPIPTAPVGLRLEGRLVVVIGAGPIAARKARAHADQGAHLRIVAPDHSPQMESVEAVERHQRRFEPADLDGAWLVVAATGDPTVDGAVFREAERRQLWCNAADDPDHCSVILPAVVRRGPLTIGISTGGTSPASASWLRRRIDHLLDPATMTVVEAATRVRDRMRADGRPTEVPQWAPVLDGLALDLAERDGIDAVIVALTEALDAGAQEVAA